MTRRPSALALRVAFSVLVGWAGLSAADVASAQPAGHARMPPRILTLEAAPLFMAEHVGSAGVIPLRVSLTNHTGRDMSGDLLLEPMGWRERDVPQRVHVDVPARQTRTLRVNQYASYSAERLQLTYTPAGLPPQRAEVPLLFRGGSGANTVVVLASPPRMRSHLAPHASPGAAASGSAYSTYDAVAEVAFSPESGDPLVPEAAAGWSSYPAVFATVADAEKLEGAARRALVGHVQAGGHLVLVPHRVEDCGAPIVRELMGEVRCTPRDASAGQGERWGGTLQFDVRGGAHTLEEEFGLSHSLGFGSVFLLGWDANAADADPAATERMLAGLVLHRARQVGAHHAHGTVPEDTASLRTALDPNEAFRPALGAVALLLLFYVFAVGPLNFRYVEQRGRPTAALLTTPAIALGCFLLMAGAAYFSKGVRMRYRAIDVIELPSDSPLGLRSRYVGYYLTRPHTFDVEPAEGARATLLNIDGGGSPPVAEQRGGALALVGMRGGLWETLVTQEQSLFDSRGEVRVTIRHDDPARATVSNVGRVVLRGALYMSASGEVFELGDIAPGETVEQPLDARATLYDWELRAGHGSSHDVEQAASAMGLPPEDAMVVRGAMSVLREFVSREGVWARVDVAPERPSAEGFALDWEHRFVFVAAMREAGVPLIVPSAVSGPPPIHGADGDAQEDTP